MVFANNVGYTAYLAGDWDGALAVMEPLLAEDIERTDRVLLLSNVLVIRASLGEDVTAGLGEIEQMVKLESEQMLTALLDPLATAALAAGRLSEASDGWRRMASTVASIGPAAHYQAARPMLWAGDAEAARTDLAAIDATGVHGRVVEIRRSTVRAGIAALEGETVEAMALYRDALRGWRDTNMVWDEALTAIDMATLLDPTDPEVRAAADAARTTLVRLGAAPFVARLDAALERVPKPAPRVPRSAERTSVPSPEAV
jgi:hypothetical protein